MKRLIFAVILFACAMLLAADAQAQRVRLRSKITPACGSSSNLKFADLYGEGNIAVLGSYNCRGAFIFDISNPDAPVMTSWYNPNGNQQFLEAIVIGNRGYFGSGNGGGVHIVDLSNPANPTLLGVVNATNGNGHNSIHEMVVFSQNGQTYLVENYNSLSGNKILKVINVTNPASPQFVRDITPTEVQWIHAMSIRGNRMFTSGWGNASSRGRTEIYDISNIATSAPTLLGFIEDTSSTTAGNSMHSSWSSEDGNYLYSCRETSNGSGDVRVYNITNPAQPLLVNNISMQGLKLNAVTPHNPVVMGNYLYVSWYQAGIQIFDISEPANPRRVGQYDTFPAAFSQSEEEKELRLTSAPWDLICGSERLQNLLPTTFDGAWAVYPFLGQNKILAGDLKEGLFILDASAISAAPKNTVSDFDGDGRTDLSVYSPATGTWTTEASSTSATSYTNFGLSGDVITAADYDGDGKSDISVWRPSTGVWYILGSSTGFRAQQFGLSGDVPMTGDFDADGKADLAIWRPSTGVWYLQQSTLGIRIFQWGLNGDKPLAADFDGDGKSDAVVWRPSDGTWYVMQSSSSLPIFAAFGTNGDRPLAGDFTGDGLADFALYRPSTGIWYILNSSTLAFSAIRFGLEEDIPVSADYDGDGKADISVFRPSSNVWYRLDSSTGAFFARVYGQSGDRPSPSSINP